MINQINALLDDTGLYNPHELYGIFFNGKRIYICSGKAYWNSIKSARLAMHRHLKYAYSKYYLDKHILKEEDTDKFDLDKLIQLGIIEIKKVGNT